MIISYNERDIHKKIRDEAVYHRATREKEKRLKAKVEYQCLLIEGTM